METERLPKEHSPTYAYLKPVAIRCAAAFDIASSGEYSPTVQRQVQAACIADWNAALCHVISGNIKATQTDISAAIRRLPSHALVIEAFRKYPLGCHP